MKGLGFPLRFGPLGHLVRVSDAALYRDRIRALVLRRIGESPFRESVGTALTSSLFANPSPATSTLIAAQIEDAVTRYEPDVRVISTQVSQDDGFTLRVAVSYEVKASGERDTAVFDLED